MVEASKNRVANLLTVLFGNGRTIDVGTLTRTFAARLSAQWTLLEIKPVMLMFGIKDD